ncbi:class I SAM-dependent methyltransferase [Anaerolineales bacterium]
MSQRRPLGLSVYESFADRYAKYGETKDYYRYIALPAIRKLVPNVKGKRVYDAGCGTGIHSKWFLTKGAEVIASDVTPKFVEMTRKRCEDQAEVHVADLAEPLTFIEDQHVDLVFSALVLHYIENWEPVFAEFNRILKPGGAVVFSCHHPLNDLGLSPTGNYHQHERVQTTWGGFGEPRPIIQYYRGSMSHVLQPILKAGLLLEAFDEPHADEAFMRVTRSKYHEAEKDAIFLCIKARKPA